MNSSSGILVQGGYKSEIHKSIQTSFKSQTLQQFKTIQKNATAGTYDADKSRNTFHDWHAS